MSYLFDATPQGLTGAYAFGCAGLGVTGAEIRANTGTGDHGPGYLYNDWDDASDDPKEFQGLIVTPPSGGTWFAYEDGSFTFAGAPDGTYPFDYRLYVDGVDLGLQSSTITVGVPGIVGTSSITLGAVASVAAGTVTGGAPISGESAITLGTVASVATGVVSSLGTITGNSAITLGAVITTAAGVVFDPATDALPRYTITAKPRSLALTARARRTRISS